MLGISTTDRALKHLLFLYFFFVFFFVMYFWSFCQTQTGKILSLCCLCKLQRKPFSFLTNAVLFLLVDKTIVWELSTREIGLSEAEKYSFAERRNTDYCAAALGGRASSDDRVSGGRRHKGCSRCVQQSGYATPSHRRPHHHHHQHHHQAFHRTKAMPLLSGFAPLKL